MGNSVKSTERTKRPNNHRRGDRRRRRHRRTKRAQRHENVSASRIAEEILKQDRFAKNAGKSLYVYREGRYVPEADNHIKQRVQEVLKGWGKLSQWTGRLGNDVVEYIRTDVPALWARPPLDTICVKNGLLDVETEKLRPHAHEYLSPIQIPVEYNPSARCPEWDRFVVTVFPEDALDLGWEIAGYLLIPDTSLQKAILLVGHGGNGKSTYLEAVRTFIGPENVSTAKLQDFDGNRFTSAQLVGKLANICADLPDRALAETATFKAITGGDAISAEQKFKPPFTFVPYARLVFSANDLPKSADSSEGFFDRWVIVPFERGFRGTDDEIPRAKLDALLANPAELSGLLNKALVALRRLKEKGRFTESASTSAALALLRSEKDPLAQWLKQKTQSDPEGHVPVKKLRDKFNDWCKTHQKLPMNETQFGKAFARVRPEIQKAKRGPKGEQEWVYLGIKWKVLPTV